MAKKKTLEGAAFFTATPTTAQGEASQAKQPAAVQEDRPALQVRKTGNVTTCFKMNAGLLAKLKAVAYWDRRTNKDVLEEALASYFDKYEAVNGPIDVDLPRNMA